MSESTGRAGAQPEPSDHTAKAEFTIEVRRCQTVDGTDCWEAATAAETSTAAGASSTPSEALRRLAVVRARRRREWDGDAWVEYIPESSVSVRHSEQQFTITVQSFPPDEHGRQWSATTDGRDLETGACDRTVGETLRALARNFERKSRGRSPESIERTALPEHQVKMFLESSRLTRFRAEVRTRVAACFDDDGYMIGLPKLFVDGEAVGARQDTQWPDGIVLEVNHPGTVYDDLRRQFEAHLEASD